MMLTLLVVLSQFSTPEELVPRMAVLEKHLERLGAIAVAAEYNAEKEVKLERLKTLLDGGAETVEGFNELYLKMDEVRTWLLAHSVEKPTPAEGSFEEREQSWVIRNPLLVLEIKKVGYDRLRQV